MSTSKILSSNTSSLPTMQSRFDSLETLVHTYETQLIVLGMASMYLAIGPSATRYLNAKGPRLAAINGFPYRVLVSHIFLSFSMVARYYGAWLYSGEQPRPGTFDLVAGVAQVLSSLALVKMSNGRLLLGKASFQVSSCLTLFSVIMGYRTGEERWLAYTTAMLNWFIFFRVVTLGVYKYKLFGSDVVPGDVLNHFVSAPFALWAGGYNNAIPFYFGLICLLMELEKWVSRQVPNK
jgi:hypothetical protein